jgi:hypothetical protein
MSAGWQADPFGRHELRYFNGTDWTEHVSDKGVQATDEPVAGEAPPPPPPPPPAAPAAKASWKDKLKQATDQAAQLAEKGKAEIQKMQTQRAEQAANDPNTLWIGERKSVGASAMGMSNQRYRITKDRIYIDQGLVGTHSEQVLLWMVRDVDVRQAFHQTSKNVGDVVVWLDQADPSTGKTEVLLDNIEDPYAVRDLLNSAISEAKAKKQVQLNTQYHHHEGSMYGAPPATGPAPAAPQVDVADQLRKLAELRDQGVLTE